MKLKGFTLAEVMIVLTVIGILAGILIPVANNSRPDENVMKFKKAHATLANVIHELVTSDKYYKAGDLGIKANGENTKKGDFCNAFADLLSTKKIVCDYKANSADKGFRLQCTGSVGTCTLNTDFDTQIDSECKNSQNSTDNSNMGITTTDNIQYYEATLNNPFGCKIGDEANPCVNIGDWTGNGKPIYGYDSTRDYVITDSGIKTLRLYKIFCIDIDGINKGEDPFGYGIRADGKIKPGTRAKEWLEKGFQKGKNDN